jgi:hypothetical protein
MSIKIPTVRSPAFIEFRLKSGLPFYCREDRLMYLIGPLAEQTETKLVYFKDDKVENEWVLDLPQDVMPNFPAFTGRSGNFIRLNPAFAIAVKSLTGEEAGLSRIDVTYQALYIRATPAEIIERLQQAPRPR